eukprot:Skav222585  [mRNA]  locus=scaffold1897:322938:324275:+ [translate_table: standard]
MLAWVGPEETELFQDYADLIALDMDTEVRCQDDLVQIFQGLLDQLKSAQNKLAPVKSGRWFSWHQCCHDQLREFWSLRMMLLHEYPQEVEEIDKNEKPFSRLVKESGGLRLACHCLSWRVWLSCQVLWLAGKPLWQWHSSLVKDVKSPAEGLARTMWLAQNWLGDNQLKELIRVLLNTDFSKIGKYLELSQRHLDESTCTMESFVQELFYYVLSLLEKRASSLSKMTIPPEVYVGLLSEDEDWAQDTLDLMFADWRSLLLLEQNSNATNQVVASDLRVSVPPVMRLVFQLCEVGEHATAKSILKSLVNVLPDTKLIEDIHGRVRNDARMNVNKKQLSSQVQQIIVGSGALESRGVNHPAALTKDIFKRRWKRTKGNFRWKSAFYPKSEKLPQKYSLMLGAKKWGTLSEETLHRSAGAWQLVRFYRRHNLRSKRLSLQDPLAIKWV